MRSLITQIGFVQIAVRVPDGHIRENTIRHGNGISHIAPAEPDARKKS